MATEKIEHTPGLDEFMAHGSITPADLLVTPMPVVAELTRLQTVNLDLLAVCKTVADWLSSFSMPPTSTIKEKQEMLRVLDAAIALAEAKGE